MKPTLTSNQIAFMIAGSSLMFPYTFLSLLRVTPANQDVWIVALLSFLFIIILNYPLLFLTEKFRGVDIVDTHELILGKTAGKLVSGLLCFFTFFCLTACMLSIALYIKQYVLSETPLWMMFLFLIVPFSFASIKGPGVIGRLAVFIVPLIVVTVAFFALLGLEDWDVQRILPILADSTVSEIGYGAFIAACRFSEVIILFLFSFFLSKESTVKGTYFKGFIIYAVNLFLIVFSTLSFFGPDIAKHANNPFLTYSRLIGGDDMFQRVQAINLFTWFAGSITKLIIYNYMCTYILARIINKPKIAQKHLVIPVASLSYVLCLMPPWRRMAVIHFLNNDLVFSGVVLFFIILIPALVLLIYLLRKKNVDAALQQKKKQVAETERAYEQAQHEQDKQISKPAAVQENAQN